MSDVCLTNLSLYGIEVHIFLFFRELSSLPLLSDQVRVAIGTILLSGWSPIFDECLATKSDIHFFVKLTFVCSIHLNIIVAFFGSRFDHFDVWANLSMITQGHLFIAALSLNLNRFSFLDCTSVDGLSID